ncbi:pilin [Arenimonas sp. MALMAid1274]|uniref:pilin n=1 Tax=Arenimonas sp. MALMAid1274 TaxID=3411630 RepID=UPI003BA29701
MKNILPTFLAVLLAAGLALFVYDRFVLAPRLEKAGEAARVSLDQAREEAQGIARELDASVERSVAGARAALDQQASDEEARRIELERQAKEMRLSALAAEALARANMVKVGVVEHYMNTLEWPRDLAEIGMGQPADFRSGPVESIRLEPQGVILISMQSDVAPGGKLRLVPKANPSGMIDWTCRVSDYPAAERISSCKR